MSENLRLIIAMRRNRQQREADRFVQDINQVAGLAIERDSILAPEASVVLERQINECIHHRLNLSTLIRVNELVWPEVEKRMNRFGTQVDNTIFIIQLSHYCDFMFRLLFEDFAKCARKLIEFDRDSIYAVLQDLSSGFGIDMYESELSHERKYGVDIWKDGNT